MTNTHPEVTPDPTPPTPPPDTGLDYLALLRNEHQRFIQAQLPGIDFSQLSPHNQRQETDHDHA